MKSLRLSVVAAIAALLYIAGCGGGGSDATTGGTTSTGGSTGGATGGSSTGSSSTGGACTATSFAPNYVPAVGITALKRWSSFPLTVAFVNSGSWTPNQRAAANAALANWQNASSGQITFSQIASTVAANVTLAWEDVQTLGDNAVGITSTTSFGFEIRDADIRLASQDFGGGERSLALMTSIASHEVGHALGILGHSDSNQDLMFFQVNNTQAPTPRDWNTLRTAYCDNFNLSRTRDFPAEKCKTATIACPLPTKSP